ncbi:zinc finger protein 35-like [Trichogramma pretiosum]|uniref:zinc finger protein 35-like n=1 Tax=Trichogramma pretiosum TaxID=7493 RepID=UPI000C71C0BB|nr:zinc finger protein 35-like [Trichogramma pretiosum]
MDKSDKQYVCNICQEVFTLESSMMTHRDAIHNQEKNFACDKCEKKFQFRSHLSRHQKLSKSISLLP